MATMAYASSSAMFSTIHNPMSSHISTRVSKAPFLGFPLSSPTKFSFTSRPSMAPKQKEQRFLTKCQNLPVVPLDQRWMFEGSEPGCPDIWNKTWYPKASDHVNTEKQWYVVDATDKILGRLASTIAIFIRGKDLVTYTPSADMGAFVIVVNAEKVAVSGKKRTQKLYRRHSGRPGGMKVETFDQLQQRIPERIIEHAVRGMLPKGPLGRRLFTHLKVYKGPTHPHEAQKPIDLPLRDKRIHKQL
ncbi:60S ribosomal protein L13 [Dionaea muscipula]